MHADGLHELTEREHWGIHHLKLCACLGQQNDFKPHEGKELGDDLKVGLVARQPAVFEQQICVSCPRHGLLVDTIPPPGLALLEAICTYFNSCGSTKRRNILGESLVVIIYLEAFSMNACYVFHDIICIEDVGVDFLSFLSGTAGSAVPSACKGASQMQSA
jgi:hypothetical protein